MAKPRILIVEPVHLHHVLAEVDTIQRAQASEHHGYLVKPWEEEELQAAIEAALRRHNTAHG